MLQAIANGMASGVIYALLAVGFGLLHSATGVLNFAYIVSVLFAGLVFASVSMGGPAGVTLAVGLGVACSVMYTLGVDRLAVRPLERKGARGGGLFLSALALYIASANLLAVCLGTQTRGIDYAVSTSQVFGLAILGTSQTFQVAAFLLAVPVLYWLVNVSAFGMRLRAFALNIEVATTLGYDVRHLRTQALAVAGALAGVAGILVTLDQGIAPYDGIDVFLFATAAWIVGGPGNLLGGLWAGPLLGVIRSLAAQWGAGAWVEGLPLMALVLFVLLTPERLRSAAYRSDMPTLSREL